MSDAGSHKIAIEVGNAYSIVHCDYILREKLRDLLSYETEGAVFARQAMPFWDGKVRLMDKAGSFPTGLLDRLVGYLEANRLSWTIIENRTPAERIEALKGKFPFPPRDYQTKAVELTDEKNRGVFYMGTGCLTGDTVININRRGNGKRVTLEQAYRGFIGTRQDQSVPTMIRSHLGERIGLNLVKGFKISGIKKVYRLVLKNGFSIRATACHEFLTPTGFQRLDQLKLSDQIVCDLDRKPRGEIKKHYKQVKGLKFHPFASKTISREKRGNWTRGRMYRVPLHRLVAEARDSRIPLEEFVRRCRNGDVDGLIFYDSKIFAVHHIDSNHLNNDPFNLLVTTHEEHLKIHGENATENFGFGIPTPVDIAEISACGKEMTYDVICNDPFRNFIANGMVVHNSGKSLTAGLVVDRRRVETLMVVPDTGLREQMINHFKDWFGYSLVSPDVKSDAPIVIANIQSLTNKKPEHFHRFGMLMVDEFHHAAAKSYLSINKWCKNAYYRYGFTGTFMRADGQDMTMHGVLANVIFKKSTSELIEEGYLVRPYITIYRYELFGHSRLAYKDAYDAVIADEGFNALVARIAKEKIKERKQTLVLVRRKDHGKLLNDLIGDSIYLSGDDDVAYREKVKASFIAKKIPCLVATNIFGEGIDIPSIDSLINARCQKSEIQTSQGLGRALRKTEGKDKAEVFDFLIVGQRNLLDHSLERIRAYKKEPAFRIQVRRA